jgi:hypothetical protein
MRSFARTGAALLLSTSVLAAPADAATLPITTKVTAGATIVLNPGGTAGLTVTVTNGPTTPPGSVAADATVDAGITLQYKQGGADRPGAGDVITDLHNVSGSALYPFQLGGPGNVTVLTYQLQEIGAPADIPLGGVLDDDDSVVTISDPGGGLTPVTAHFDLKIHGLPAPAGIGVGGTVVDAAGAPIANAHVSIEDSSHHALTTTSGTDGIFTIVTSASVSIAGGPLTFTFSKAGYATAVRSGVTFTVGHNLNIGSTTMRAATATVQPAATTASPTVRAARTVTPGAPAASAAPGPASDGTTTPAAVTGTPASPIDRAPAAATGGSSLVPWIAGIAIAVLIAGGAGVVLMRRTRRSS